MDVNSLINHLVANGVAHFEGYGVKVSFHRPQSQTVSIPIQQPAVAKAKIEIESTESIGDQAGMAQQMEAELEYDKVLNWSASPDPNEKETPLTGDAQPLTQQG